MKLRENTKQRIIILLGATILFAFHWIASAITLEGEIDHANKQSAISQISEEVKNSRIARAVKDYDESSTLCLAAITVYSIAIAGYIYFDYREKRE